MPIVHLTILKGHDFIAWNMFVSKTRVTPGNAQLNVMRYVRKNNLDSFRLQHQHCGCQMFLFQIITCVPPPCPQNGSLTVFVFFATEENYLISIRFKKKSEGTSTNCNLGDRRLAAPSSIPRFLFEASIACGGTKRSPRPKSAANGVLLKKH